MKDMILFPLAVNILYSLIILVPFFIVNGILTGGLGKTVVSYNPLHNLNIRLYTIPLENVVYRLILCTLNIFFIERALEHKAVEKIENSHC